MDGSPHPGVDLIPDADWPRVAEALRLTPREREVARLVVGGRTRRQIAGRLGCSTSTVRQHIDRLFAKAEVAERVGLVLRLVRVWLGRTTAAGCTKVQGAAPGAGGKVDITSPRASTGPG